MVIYSGKKGSMTFFFENKIVGSLPLGKRSIDDYYIQRDRLLREALEAKQRAAAERRAREEKQEMVGEMAVVGSSVLIGILIIAVVLAVLLAMG